MVDGRRFRNACHEAARRTGGTVTGFHLAHGVTPNFPQGIIATSRDTGPLPFVDAPAPVAALKALPEFRVLTYTDACRPFEAAAWPSIDPSDLKYWT